jgi:2-methylcitrate dehydratase
MKNGKTISEEINVADAHPAGKRPFGRREYINKFKTLTDGIITKNESARFLKVVQNLRKLKAKDLKGLNVEVMHKVKSKFKSSKGIF